MQGCISSSVSLGESDSLLQAKILTGNAERLHKVSQLPKTIGPPHTHGISVENGYINERLGYRIRSQFASLVAEPVRSDNSGSLPSASDSNILPRTFANISFTCSRSFGI
jgi:hypothetical protein